MERTAGTEPRTGECRFLTGIVIGAGSRGVDAYAPWLEEHPEEGRIVAIAEPNATRRQRFAARYGIAPEMQFESHDDVFARDRFADFVVVATPDRAHVAPAIRAMERGYDVLLEKPMAVSAAECRELVAVAERTGRLLQICHVLRYAPFFARVKEIVDSGELGRVVTIQHAENVSHYHYAHSYVRGLYRNREASSPMILAKSCHDLDILYWLAGGAEPVRLTSLARPAELRAANAPEGAPEYCSEGCPHAARCPYDAVAMYERLTPLLLDMEMTREAKHAWLIRLVLRLLRTRKGLVDLLTFGRSRRLLPWQQWPVSQVVDEVTWENLRAALRTTPWGRCVYRVGDNDQVASQSVNVQFANGVNAAFTMHGNAHREGREIRIDGTKGSLQGGFWALDQVVRVTDHKTGRTRKEVLPLVFGAHGGGDRRLMAGFLAALRGEAAPLTTARESLWSHLMAFAADEAAREGRVVELPATNATP